MAELGRLSLDPSTRLPPRRMFHPRQGERPRARRWIPAREVPARRGGAPSGGMDSCLRRKDGWRGVGGERDVLAELGRLSLDPSTRLPPRRMFHLRQGERNSPPLGMDSGSGGPGSAGGCAFRRDGFLPPQERRMEGGWGGGGETEAGVRSGSVSRSRPLCERLPCSLRHRACSTAPCRGRTACSRAGPASAPHLSGPLS